MSSEPEATVTAEAVLTAVTSHALLGPIGSIEMILDLLDDELDPLTRHTLIEQGKQQVAFVTALLLDALAPMSDEVRAALDALGSDASAAHEGGRGAGPAT